MVQVTSWVEDAHSISLYGRREARASAQATTNATAIAQATRLVNERSAPLRSVRAGSGEDGATLACVGYWRTLDWRFWSQSAGLTERDEGCSSGGAAGLGVDQFGAGVRATVAYDWQPGCESDGSGADGPGDCERHDLGTNDGTYEITAPDDRTAQTVYTSDEFYFDTSDDVHDADGLLNQWRAADVIEIADSTSNDGVYFIKDFIANGDGLYDHMRVIPARLQMSRQAPRSRSRAATAWASSHGRQPTRCRAFRLRWPAKQQNCNDCDGGQRPGRVVGDMDQGGASARRLTI